jgi:aspartyl-tRNA(Asn)/glutamyl-tRNA(Gln) amidotransferase subunit A
MSEKILTIADAAVAMRDGTTTSVAITQEILDRTATLNSALGAYVEVTADAAL